ncbi:MAG TPA: endonuclease V [Candidatus Methanoperedens sp.]
MDEMDAFFPHGRESQLAAQRLVSERAVVKDAYGVIHFIAGVDQAFVDDKIISGIVVLDYNSLAVMEKVHSIRHLDFPYIPTFLSFREGPAIIDAYEKLSIVPDMLIVDGAGINHPRRAGIATHIGVALDVPTIGITKKILCGVGKEPQQPGEANPLVYNNSRVGWLFKTGRRSRAIVVAPGHRISLDSSLSVVRACLRGHKLPEPVKLAHEYVSGLKKKWPNH